MTTECEDKIGRELDQINGLVQNIEQNVQKIEHRHVKYMSRRSPFIGVLHAILW